MEREFTVKISDRRVIDHLRSADRVQLMTPKNCKRCRAYKRKCKLQQRRRDEMPEVSLNWQPSPLHQSLRKSRYISHESTSSRHDSFSSSYHTTENNFNTPITPFLSNNHHHYTPKQQNGGSCNESRMTSHNGDAKMTQLILNDASTIVSEGLKCRYCYQGEGETLISPCHCDGSSKFVHKSCLERWLTLRNGVECEICKFKYKTKWHRNPIWKLSLPPMKSRDVMLLLATVFVYVTLILQFLAAVFVGVVGDSQGLPAMVRAVTLVALGCGLLWFLVGSITLTIVLYTSDYWDEVRRMNRYKLLICDENFCAKQPSGENGALLRGDPTKTTREEHTNIKVRVVTQQPLPSDNITVTVDKSQFQNDDVVVNDDKSERRSSRRTSRQSSRRNSIPLDFSVPIPV